MYKKILVPLDGSSFSECILEHVKNISLGCAVPEVVLLRVIEPWSTQIYGIPESYQTEAQQKVKDEARKHISKVAKNLRKEGISVKLEVIEGKPDEVILNYTVNNEIDLIVMSTHGWSGITRWVLGSTADRIVRHSSVPVLIASPEGCRVKS